MNEAVADQGKPNLISVLVLLLLLLLLLGRSWAGGWLICWPAGWLVGWLASWLSVLLAGWLADLVTGWLGASVRVELWTGKAVQNRKKNGQAVRTVPLMAHGSVEKC